MLFFIVPWVRPTIPPLTHSLLVLIFISLTLELLTIPLVSIFFPNIPPAEVALFNSIFSTLALSIIILELAKPTIPPMFLPSFVPLILITISFTLTFDIFGLTP